MEKTVFDIMSENPEKIDGFFAACDEMLKTQYILADVKIEGILRSIALSKLLYRLFGEILRDFDYKSAAKKCIVAEDMQFVMPDDPKKAAALGFNLLLDLDKKSVILKDFLQFFSDGSRACDLNTCFDNFLIVVIAPFKNAVKSLLDAAADEVKARKDAAEAIQGRKRRQQEFDRIIGTFVARIHADPALNIIIKDDITILGGELLTAVHTGDMREAQKAYTRLYKKIKAHKPKLITELEKIEISEM